MNDLIKKIIMNDTFKKIIPFVLIAALLLIYIFIVLPILRGCSDNKSPVTSPPVTRDSIFQIKIDSLINANESLNVQNDMLNQKIKYQELNRTFNNKILQYKYEIIQNTPPDSLYLHTMQYIDGWEPDSTAQ